MSFCFDNCVFSISKEDWDKNLDYIANNALVDPCTGFNPRVPTLEELKESFTSAFNDYLEIAEDLDEDWIDEVKSIERVEYVMNIPSLFKLLPELKISSIAKKAGINESLMRQYASGKANASEERAKIIENAIHELGQELISVSL